MVSPRVGRRTQPLLTPSLVLCYAICLHLAYGQLVAPLFTYLGFGYQTPVWGLYGVALVGVAALSAALPSRLQRPSDFVIWILFLITVVPVMLVPHYTGVVSPATSMAISFWVGSSFGLTLLIVRFASVHPGATALSLRLPPALFWAGWLAFALATVGLLAAVTGVRPLVAGLGAAYEIRDVYRVRLGGFPLLPYMLSAQAYILNPLLLVHGVRTRRWFTVVAVTGLQYYLYTQTGFKTYLLSVPLLLAVAVVIHPRVRTAILPVGLVAGITGAAVLDVLARSILFTSLFTRRFLSVPGVLMAEYVDFFNNHVLAKLSHSVLEGWFSYPYDLPIPYLIGRYMLVVRSNAANANLYADAFANFGWVGVLVVGVLLGFVLVLADRAAHGLPIAVSAVVLTMPCIALANSALLTVLVTHGLGLGIVALALAPKGSWQPPSPKPRRRNLLG